MPSWVILLLQITQDKLESWYDSNGIFKRISDYVYHSAFSVYEDHRTFIPLPVSSMQFCVIMVRTNVCLRFQ